MAGTTTLQQAATAFEHGDLETAQRQCRAILASDPRNADAAHLLGLTLKRSGRTDEAESLLRASIELAPSRSEFRINLSNLLAATNRVADAIACLAAALERDPASRPVRLALARLENNAGRPAAAEQTARALLQTDARDAEAWSALAAAQRDQGRLADAEASFRRAVELAPDYAIARHNLGAVLGRLKRAAESLTELLRAEQLGVRGPELELNKARARMDLGELDAAENGMAQIVAQSPSFLDAQVTLAKLRHMRGDHDFARALADAAQHSEDPALTLALGDLWRRAGHLAEAASLLDALAARLPDVPEIASSLAVVLQERGDLERARALALSASRAHPQDAAMTENLIAILLQCGDADAAQPLIADARDAAPLDQRWLAYAATAARLEGRREYDDLYDYDRFVGEFELEPAPGHGDLTTFNAALGTFLAEQHALRSHPLDQSLRYGTQSIRDLRHEHDEAMRAFLAAIREPIEDYRRRLGHDPDHPFLTRNAGPTELAGCWSVELHRSGYHVNHIHPEGWISSAYYVSVPAEVDDPATRSGWLKLGEPRMPTPGATPARFVQPRAGKLVLFPSYMWHGTTPLNSDEPRLTIAFDAVPMPREGS